MFHQKVPASVQLNCPQWRTDQPPPCPPPPSWASEDWGGVVGRGSGSGRSRLGRSGEKPSDFSSALLSAPRGSGSGLGLPHPLLPRLFAPFLLSPHHPLSSSESFLFSPLCVFLSVLGALSHSLSLAFSFTALVLLSFPLFLPPLLPAPGVPLSPSNSPASPA